MNPGFQSIFLIGPARSGTKILRDVIAAHPAIDRVPFDVNYIWRLGNENLPHDELTPDLLTLPIAQRIARRLAAYHQGAPCLIEKTVSNCLRIPFLDALYPEARYIFLIRDGRDVVESVYRQWLVPADWKYLLEKARTYPLLDAPGYALSYALNFLRKRVFRSTASSATTWGPRYEGIDRDVAARDLTEICAIQWVRCIEKAQESLRRVDPERQITIRYEEFVASPKQHFEKIAQFLNIDHTPYHSTDLLASISAKNIGKGWLRLTETQRSLIRPIIQSTLTSFGYDVAMDKPV